MKNGENEKRSSFLQPQQPDDQYPGVPVQGWTPPPPTRTTDPKALAARLRELKEANDKAESEQFEYDEGGYDDAYVHAYHTKQELDDFIHDNLPAIIDAMERGEEHVRCLRKVREFMDRAHQTHDTCEASGTPLYMDMFDTGESCPISDWIDDILAKAALAPRAGGGST